VHYSIWSCGPNSQPTSNLLSWWRPTSSCQQLLYSLQNWKLRVNQQLTWLINRVRAIANTSEIQNTLTIKGCTEAATVVNDRKSRSVFSFCMT